ncbi:hypothetical protein [Desulfitobacterium sp.]|uniref:hypothetical protein n=1 Tax=Desulfitobacterium sp. TaxID=49981 RepID=UPI002B1EF4CF|nr:hypothetical protein [Desulfitobacterium sp.]MEA4901310.1 hypothetical protein [Desulfitobacterium sp.]
MTKLSRSLGFLFTLIFLFAITGCNNSSGSRSMNFIGESEHWIANYSISQGQSQTNIGKISYKGTDVESVGLVKYAFEASPYVGVNGSIDLPPRGYIELTNTSSKGPYPNKDLVIKAKIEWNGQIENMDLKYTNQ